MNDLPLEINDFLQHSRSFSQFHGHLFEVSSCALARTPSFGIFRCIGGRLSKTPLEEFSEYFLIARFLSPHDSWPLTLPCLAGSFPHIPASGVSMRWRPKMLLCGVYTLMELIRFGSALRLCSHVLRGRTTLL